MAEQKYQHNSSQYNKQFDQTQENIQKIFQDYKDSQKELNKLIAEKSTQIEKINQEMNPKIKSQEHKVQELEILVAESTIQRRHAFQILEKYEIRCIAQGTDNVSLNNDTPGGPQDYEQQLQYTAKQLFRARIQPKWRVNAKSKAKFERNITQSKQWSVNANYINEFGKVCNKIS